MANKTIKMIATEGSTSVTITETFSGETSWFAIAYQFYKFLVAQGFRLDHEDVGADVESYVMSVNEDSEEW
jgi:hypothetical protein